MKLKLLLLLALYYCCSITANAQGTFFYSGGSTGNTVPFNIGPTGNNKAQWLMLPSYFNAPSGMIRTIYFHTTVATGNFTLTSLSVSLGQTSIANFTTGANVSFFTGLTNVYSATTTTGAIMAGGWIKIDLQTPFNYDNTKKLIVEASALNLSGLSLFQRTAAAGSRIYGNVAATTGTGDLSIIDFGLDLVKAGADNAGVLDLSGPPTTAFCPGSAYAVNARVLNYGINRVTGLKIGWILDGIKQPDVNYGNLIDTMGSTGSAIASIKIANLGFTSAASHTIKAYTMLPNGNADTTNNNDTFSMTWTALANPQLTSPTYTYICPGNAVNVVLNASPATATNYVWYKDGQVIPSAITSSYTATTFGKYMVQISGVPAGTCGGNTDIVPVDSFNMPVPLVNPTGNRVVCTGDSVVLKASTGIAGAGYQWMLNGNLITGATDSNYVVYIPGNYTVLAGKYNCNALSAGTNVISKGTPAPVISDAGHILSTDTTGIVSYKWYISTATVPIPTALPGDTMSYCIPKKAGNYTVVVFNGGCSATSQAYTVDSMFLDVNTIYSTNAIHVYPNPATNILHVDAPANTGISISGMDGRMLIHQDAQNDIDICHLPGALYIIRITDKNGALISMQKFTKLSQ